MAQKIILSVTSDLVTDQRVHKVALSLHKAGYEVILFGRKKNASLTLEDRPYRTYRTRLLFEKGFLFYANYNLRLFFFLLFHKADILLSNDLDTLLPNFLIAKLLNRKLVYDTHEYFTGVPELENRWFVKKIWKSLENYLVPRIQRMYTVNDSIAKLYHSEYGVNIRVVRNLPLLHPVANNSDSLPEALKVKWEKLKNESRKIILYQGAINKDRGLEEAILAMQWVENVCFVIIGSGDIELELKTLISKHQLENKVLMLGQVPFQYLAMFTPLAWLGLSIEKDTNINYKYASPNKVVDYIRAGVPVLYARLIEIEKIVSVYDTGTYIQNHDPVHIASVINKLVPDTETFALWKSNCLKAASELTWENEEKTLLEIFK